ncbi:MAG: hypothetical protein ACRER6_16510, partial [Pseudomonas sp.]
EQFVVLGNCGTGKKGAGQGGQCKVANRRHGESSWNSWCVGFFMDFWNRVAGSKIAAFGSSYR